MIGSGLHQDRKSHMSMTVGRSISTEQPQDGVSDDRPVQMGALAKLSPYTARTNSPFRFV